MTAPGFIGGQVDVDKLPLTPYEKGLARRQTEAIRERMSPKGALGLPELLEARRIEYGIPDEAFAFQAVYDRVYTWQVSDFHGQANWGDTRILMPESVDKAETFSSPRGIIVSAGLLALEELHSNGMDLGHMVRFIRLTPWRHRIGVVLGHEMYLLLIRSGDICASEDTHGKLRTGELKIRNHRIVKDGEVVDVYVYEDNEGVIWRPRLPDIPEDY